jgi:hypothetical protein
MAWEALGADPVPGDPAAVRAAAGSLGTVEKQVEAVHRQLGALAGGIGPDVWRGTAADGFAESLRRLVPDASRLAAAHGVASRALYRYADVLDGAQGRARAAEADAAREQTRHRQAMSDQQAADADAASQTAVERKALARLAEARLLRLNPLADPAYLAELAQWEHGVEAQRTAAARRAAEARARADAARRTAQEASLEFARARGRADKAREIRDEAAGATVREIQGAMPPDAPKLLDYFTSPFGAVSAVAGLIDDASGDRWKKGPYPKHWKVVLDLLRGGDPVRYKRSGFLHWVADTYKKTPLHGFPGMEKRATALAGNRLLGFVSWVDTIGDVHEGIGTIRENANAHDRLGVATGGMQVGGALLKRWDTPVTYLSGVVLTQYADVIKHVREVDWSYMPPASDWIKYGPAAARDAGWTTVKEMEEWFL